MARTLDEIARARGSPEEIVLDNGPEGTSRAMFDWSDTWRFTCFPWSSLGSSLTNKLSSRKVVGCSEGLFRLKQGTH